MKSDHTTGLGSVLIDHGVVIVCGSGGVGKTTTSAVIALEAARRGRHAVVVTIDPAKRLANALGLSHLSDAATEVHRGHWDPHGTADPGGQLFAVMLDTKSTFDRLVQRYSASSEQAERIFENRFYRNLTSALSGTQEYMAMERLHELHEDGAFDLIVVDTPPSRHALDFLDAPKRLLRLLEHPLFRMLMMPTRAGMRAAGFALRSVLRATSRVVGTEVIDDAVAFFRAFEGMEEGFRERAHATETLIASDRTAFVLVTSPRRDALDEARFFTERLEDNDLYAEALVINRVHPRFTERTTDELQASVKHYRDLMPAVNAGGAANRLAALTDNLASFQAVTVREREHLDDLGQRVAPEATVHVPFLVRDVHDFEALAEVGTYLFDDGAGSDIVSPGPEPHVDQDER